MYGLFKATSDCEVGYYFYEGTLESISEEVIDTCMEMINQYCSSSYDPEDIVRFELNEDEEEHYDFYTEMDDLAALIEGSTDKLDDYSFCISDSNLDIIIRTDDDKKLYDVCIEIDDEIESKTGAEAAEELVNKHSWQ